VERGVTLVVSDEPIGLVGQQEPVASSAGTVKHAADTLVDACMQGSAWPAPSTFSYVAAPYAIMWLHHVLLWGCNMYCYGAAPCAIMWLHDTLLCGCTIHYYVAAPYTIM